MTTNDIKNERGVTAPSFGSDLASSGSLQGQQYREIARSQQEVQAEVIMARMYPRDETAAAGALMRSCDRPSFAEKTSYSYPRGGQEITGPSVHLAREAARVWGHIAYGIDVVGMTPTEVHIKGWARDNQTGTRVVAEARVKKLIFRKNKGWVEPDERDLREMVNRHGAIAERNAILKLLPPDMISAALGRARTSMKRECQSALKENPRAVAVKVVESFKRLGVTAGQLKKWLGGIEVHEMDEEQFVRLRTIKESIEAGNSEAAEYFESEEPAKTPTEDMRTRSERMADELADNHERIKDADVVKPQTKQRRGGRGKKGDAKPESDDAAEDTARADQKTWDHGLVPDDPDVPHAKED